MTHQSHNKKEWLAYGVYTLVALAVMLPLLKPGFILTMDMVFTPELRLPDQLSSSYPFHALLHVLNMILPADVIQKILLLVILPLASIGLHRLVRVLKPVSEENDWGIYVASIFFAINPFTYSRFMAGQYAVLLGYALLPWFARLLLRFMNRPNMFGALKLGGLATGIGIVSIHTLAGLIIMSLLALIIVFWRYHAKLKQFLRFGLIASGLFVLLSGFWLSPLLLGEGKTAHMVDQFTASDTQAFASRGEGTLAQTGHIIRLQGFWAEDNNLFLLPQQKTILWGLMSIAILGLVVSGAVQLWRRSLPLAVFFIAGGILAIVLALGVISSLANNVSLLAGLREPHKLVGLLALSYSVFMAFGIHAFLEWMREKGDTAYSIAAVVILLMPLLFMRVMFWGFAGQLVPRHYPADWLSVNQRLSQDQASFETLFLPWYQYMSFNFSGRIIANPAAQFFDKPVLASTDPELQGATSGQQDAKHRALDRIIAGDSSSDFSTSLTEQNIKYVILAKELDYDKYQSLLQQPNLKPIVDSPTMTLFENMNWRQP
jgi:hypothetical protein